MKIFLMMIINTHSMCGIHFIVKTFVIIMTSISSQMFFCLQMFLRILEKLVWNITILTQHITLHLLVPTIFLPEISPLSRFKVCTSKESISYRCHGDLWKSILEYRAPSCKWRHERANCYDTTICGTGLHQPEGTSTSRNPLEGHRGAEKSRWHSYYKARQGFRSCCNGKIRISAPAIWSLHQWHQQIYTSWYRET